MKIPNDLPWLQSDFMVADFFNTEEVEYAQWACNNFPKAIELLNKILSYYELDSEGGSDGEILDLIKPEIEGFLSNLEDE